MNQVWQNKTNVIQLNHGSEEPRFNDMEQNTWHDITDTVEILKETGEIIMFSRNFQMLISGMYTLYY